MPIEQAVFTSARTARGDGYQLVAQSPGVSDNDARELAVWGPSHGTLCTQRDEATSINFCRLAGGMACISKTVAAGQEYSGRGGARIYTHFLLVPSDILSRFANNPFAVLRAAWAKGMLGVHDRWPDDLESFSLAGRSAAVDEGLLAQLAERCGPARVAQLVQAAMSPGVHLLAGAGNTETLLGGLLQCFPVDCRPEISFSTGLRYSPRRQFRLSPLDADRAEQRRAVRHEGVAVIDFSASPEESVELSPWAAAVANAISADRLASFAGQLQQTGVTIDQLDRLGEQLLRERSTTFTCTAAGTQGSGRTASLPRPPLTSAPKPPAARPIVMAGFNSSAHTVSDPASIEQMEQLDDAVYDVINGAEEKLAQINNLWQQLSKKLPPSALSAAREQYLRYALSLWDASQDESNREPQRACRALDLLSVLFEPE